MLLRAVCEPFRPDETEAKGRGGGRQTVAAGSLFLRLRELSNLFNLKRFSCSHVSCKQPAVALPPVPCDLLSLSRIHYRKQKKVEKRDRRTAKKGREHTEFHRLGLRLFVGRQPQRGYDGEIFWKGINTRHFPIIHLLLYQPSSLPLSLPKPQLSLSLSLSRCNFLSLSSQLSLLPPLSPLLLQFKNKVTKSLWVVVLL